MTDRIKEYRKILEESNPDELEKPTKEMACEWLDAQIEYHVELQKLNEKYIFPLVYGKLLLDRGEYEYEIKHTVYGAEPVLYGYQPNLTVYSGIEKLAEIMCEELRVCEFTKSHLYCYWFKYGKYIIDQIERYPIEGVKCKREEWRK